MSLELRFQGIKEEQAPEYCHQCGKCSSGCPVTSFLDFRPRKIVAMVQLGMIEELLESKVIWECAQCLACKERCPRDVAPYDIIQTLQNLSFKNNHTFPQGYSKIIDSILKNGIIQDPVKVRSWKKLPKGETEKGEREIQNRSTLKLPHLNRPTELKKFAQTLKNILKGKKK